MTSAVLNTRGTIATTQATIQDCIFENNLSAVSLLMLLQLTIRFNGWSLGDWPIGSMTD